MPSPSRRHGRDLVLVGLAAVLTVVGVAAAHAVGRRTRPRVARALRAAARPAPARTPAATPRPTVTAHRRWVLVSLGDSVPAGSACGCRAFPDLYAHRISRGTGRPLTVHNDAVPGLGSRGLLTQLRTSARVRRHLAAADVVTVTIGANDFSFATYQQQRCPALRCYQAQLRRLTGNLDAAFDVITRLLAGHPAVVKVTGYWEIWKDGTVGRQRGTTYMKVGDALTRAVNAVISRRAAAHGFSYVDLYAAFHGPGLDRDDTSLLAADGDHPSEAGHRLIAATLMATGLAPLLP